MTKRPALGRPWRRTVAYVIQRDGATCQLRYPGICTHTATTADHILHRSRGGTDNPDNLRASCQPCNQHRSNNPDTTTDESRQSKPWAN